MITDLKFFDKLYVGFSKRSGNTEDDLLGFATPDGNDKAAEKRKATVDGWRSKDIEPKIVANEPRMGFKILDSRRRYRGNKVFRVYDPAGFELEISAENLCDLIDRSIINKGDILDQLVWGRLGAANYLIPSSSEEYKAHLRGPTKIDLEPGMYLVNKTKTIAYRYEGRFNFRGITAIAHNLYRHPSSGGTTRDFTYGFYSSKQTFLGHELEYTLTKPKQAHVYSRFSISQTEDDDGEQIFEMTCRTTSYHYETSTSPIKNLEPIEVLLTEREQNSVKELFKLVRKPVTGRSVIDNNAILSSSIGYGKGVTIFFETPKDARAFAPSDEEVIAHRRFEMFDPSRVFHFTADDMRSVDSKEYISHVVKRD
jgi:hypothetical protein